MISRPLTFSLAIALVTSAVLLSARSLRNATPISPAEAEILVYISPYAHSVRAAGYDVVPDRKDVRQQKGFINFYVVTTMPKPAGGGIEMPEYFAVNTHTGTLWDSGADKRVQSPQLRDVLRVLRRSRGITAEVMRRFDSLGPERSPYLVTPRPTGATRAISGEPHHLVAGRLTEAYTGPASAKTTEEGF